MQEKQTKPGEKAKHDLKEKTTYRFGNRSFIVEPVFKEETQNTLGYPRLSGTSHYSGRALFPVYMRKPKQASSVADVSSSGLLTVTNQYQGIPGKTTKGEITTYIEKKTWGLFWKRVDIGEPNNEWYDVIYNYVYAGDHTFQLPSKGTYRITVVYVISGSGGAPDTITRTIKKTY